MDAEIEEKAIENMCIEHGIAVPPAIFLHSLRSCFICSLSVSSDIYRFTLVSITNQGTLYSLTAATCTSVGQKQFWSIDEFPLNRLLCVRFQIGHCIDGKWRGKKENYCIEKCCIVEINVVLAPRHCNVFVKLIKTKWTKAPHDCGTSKKRKIIIN